MMVDIQSLITKCGLGQQCIAAEPLTGGLLHRMYKVQTDEGIYCIKEINPEVAARPEALGNIEKAERVARALQDHLPLVAAKQYEESVIVSHEQRYYIVFDYIEGASVFPPRLTPQHAQAIGRVLALIHEARVCPELLNAAQETAAPIDWSIFSGYAAPAFQKALPDLLRWSEQAAEAEVVLAQMQVVSHRDLDPKNVMWQGETPVLIDWEAAGPVNPQQELAEVVAYWADDGRGDLQEEAGKALLKAYHEERGLSAADWPLVMAGAKSDMLGWLEYNVKRAMCLIEGPPEDQQLGAEQVEKTLTELYAFDAHAKRIQTWIGQILANELLSI